MIDQQECINRGIVGSMGAIPGTLMAHPFDLMKIRLQIMNTLDQTKTRQNNKTTIPLSTLFADVIKQGPLAGIGAGILQKVTTRGFMFFTSEVCTQTCQYVFDLNRDVAVFMGSLGSGYMTGFMAAPAEWAKVQIGAVSSSMNTFTMNDRVTTLEKRGGWKGGGSGWKKGGTIVHLVTSGVQYGQSVSVMRRFHGAGLRNAIFDGTFFGSEHMFRTEFNLPYSISYAMAASLAVFIDYPLDVAVKRGMAVSPLQVVPSPLEATWRLCRDAGWRVYRGLGCKGVEFAVSYFVTGAFAPIVMRGLFLATAGTLSSSSTVLADISE